METVDDFSVTKPSNLIVGNLGILFGLSFWAGLIFFWVRLFKLEWVDGNNTEGVRMMLGIFFSVAGLFGYLTRMWICRKNPVNAMPISQEEIMELADRMQGSWQSSVSSFQRYLQVTDRSLSPGELEIADGRYQYKYINSHGNEAVGGGEMDFYRTEDGKLYFRSVGAQVFLLDLPDTFAFVDYLGTDITWTKVSGDLTLQTKGKREPNTKDAGMTPAVQKALNEGTDFYNANERADSLRAWGDKSEEKTSEGEDGGAPFDGGAGAQDEINKDKLLLE